VATQFDYEAFGSDGQLALVVEVKARRGANTDWARLLRENLFAEAKTASAMFMLVTLDGIYLWERAAPLNALATYELNATKLFAPYFQQAGVDPSKAVNPILFEAIVGSWLDDRTRGRGPSDPLLDEAGLTDVLKGGRIVAPAAA
jgi:hypothetical protein